MENEYIPSVGVWRQPLIWFTLLGNAVSEGHGQSDRYRWIISNTKSYLEMVVINLLSISKMRTMTEDIMDQNIYHTDAAHQNKCNRSLLYWLKWGKCYIFTHNTLSYFLCKCYSCISLNPHMLNKWLLEINGTLIPLLAHSGLGVKIPLWIFTIHFNTKLIYLSLIST